MSTAIYVRSARPGPMELARQREQCEDYAREHGLIVTRVYADTGHARDGLSALLREAPEQNTTDLIVTHLYRLSREASTYFQTCDALSEAGITLHSISEEAFMANPYLRNLARVLADADQSAENYDDDKPTS
ncbi:recombinase family protein [Amycolatopsis sacchari]|uniref:recombinase family protein n=1 Tax=Amycolatopsis TaxID=1813 RepID=UPI003D7510B6